MENEITSELVLGNSERSFVRTQSGKMVSIESIRGVDMLAPATEDLPYTVYFILTNGESVTHWVDSQANCQIVMDYLAAEFCRPGLDFQNPDTVLRIGDELVVDDREE